MTLPLFAFWDRRFKSHSSWDIVLLKVKDLVPLLPLMKTWQWWRERLKITVWSRDQKSRLRRVWSWQRLADNLHNADLHELHPILVARTKKICLYTYVHTYSLPRFIIGTMAKEKFDHKQRDIQHKTVVKLTPTVNNNLYSAVKVTPTKE